MNILTSVFVCVAILCAAWAIYLFINACDKIDQIHAKICGKEKEK